MKILLDQGLPHSAVVFLRELGHAATHVSEVGLTAATDSAILDYARTYGMFVVTLDADFHSILALENKKDPSVIRIRKEGLKGKELCAMIVDIIARCQVELTKGAILTICGERLRIRLLPLRQQGID